MRLGDRNLVAGFEVVVGNQLRLKLIERGGLNDVNLMLLLARGACERGRTVLRDSLVGERDRAP